MRPLLGSGVLCALVAGCSARATLRDPHEGQLSITIHNEAGASICTVHIFLAGNEETGHNWLQAQPEIAIGDSRAFWVPGRDPAETYQVQANGCPGAKPQVSGYAPSVIMNAPATVVLFDEANPRSKDAATTLAHTNENTTLIPAKFSRGSSPRAR